jgi:hypothetical protein
MSKLQPVGAHETCPCGSGKEYIDCCLDKKFRYVKDEHGTITKIEPHMPAMSKRKTPIGEDEDNGLSPEDLDDFDINPLLVFALCEHGHVHCSTTIQMDMDKVDVEDLKSICSFIERQKARVTIAMSHNDPTKKPEVDEAIPLVVLFIDQEGYIQGMGGATVEHLIGFPMEEMLETIDCLEELRMNIMGIALHKLIDQFMFPGEQDDEEDDSPAL